MTPRGDNRPRRSQDLEHRESATTRLDPHRQTQLPVLSSDPRLARNLNLPVMDKRIDKCLGTLRKWAETRIASGNEPPWAWYQYMKLIETVAAIQVGRSSVTPSTAGSLAVVPPASAAPRPKGDAVADIGTRRRRRRREDPPLPM